MKHSLQAVFCLFSAIALAQHADLPATNYTALNTAINSYLAFQTGSGTPTANNKACTVGKDVYTDTATAFLYVCTVTGTPGTWAQVATSRTYVYGAEGINYGGVAAFSGNLPTTVGDQPAAIFNSSGVVPVLNFVQGASNRYWFRLFTLPTGYTTNSAISYSIRSMCDPANCDSTNATNVYFSLACITSGRLDVPTFAEFATPAAITNAAAGARTVSTGTITPNVGGLPVCTAGDRVLAKLRVDTTGLASGKAFQIGSVEFSVTGAQ